jgi:protein RecA
MSIDLENCPEVYALNCKRYEVACHKCKANGKGKNMQYIAIDKSLDLEEHPAAKQTNKEIERQRTARAYSRKGRVKEGKLILGCDFLHRTMASGSVSKDGDAYMYINDRQIRVEIKVRFKDRFTSSFTPTKKELVEGLQQGVKMWIIMSGSQKALVHRATYVDYRVFMDIYRVVFNSDKTLLKEDFMVCGWPEKMVWVERNPQALDSQFMEYCGVDLGKLCKYDPNTAEEALQAVRTALSMEDPDGKPVLDLIVLDSVAALVPSEEYQKQLGGGTVAHLARLLSQSLKQIANIAGQKGVSVVLINQERAQNLMGYGKKSDTAGGNAIKYYTSIRLDLTRTKWLEDGKRKIGQEVFAETIKNRTAAPYQSTTLNLMFPHKVQGKIEAGIDTIRDIVNVALDLEIIERTGAWFIVPNHPKKINGLTNVYNIYYESPEEYKTLQELIKEKHAEKES